jgi:hypothetical protein
VRFSKHGDRELSNDGKRPRVGGKRETELMAPFCRQRSFVLKAKTDLSFLATRVARTALVGICKIKKLWENGKGEGKEGKGEGEG